MGGPLFRLKATDAISLLPSSPNDENIPADTVSDPFEDATQPVPEIAQPPVVDGNLLEIVWQKAAVLSHFRTQMVRVNHRIQLKRFSCGTLRTYILV